MTLESILFFGAFGFMVGVNAGQYDKAKEWLESHKICDCSFYEDKIRGGENDSKKDFVLFYLGYAGRYLAYKTRKK